MPLKITAKLGYILASISCLLILALAMWVEKHYLLAPCILCTLQRLMFLSSAIWCLILIFVNKKFMQLGLLLSSLLGMAIASRQVWLQYFATPIPHSCSASLYQLLRKYPLLDFIKFVFTASGECSHIDYTILGLSLAVWSLVLFSSLSVFSSWILCKKKVDF